jgi:hypothetical protein
MKDYKNHINLLAPLLVAGLLCSCSDEGDVVIERRLINSTSNSNGTQLRSEAFADELTAVPGISDRPSESSENSYAPCSSFDETRNIESVETRTEDAAPSHYSSSSDQQEPHSESAEALKRCGPYRSKFVPGTAEHGELPNDKSEMSPEDQSILGIGLKTEKTWKVETVSANGVAWQFQFKTKAVLTVDASNVGNYKFPVKNTKEYKVTLDWDSKNQKIKEIVAQVVYTSESAIQFQNVATTLLGIETGVTTPVVSVGTEIAAKVGVDYEYSKTEAQSFSILAYISDEDFFERIIGAKKDQVEKVKSEFEQKVSKLIQSGQSEAEAVASILSTDRSVIVKALDDVTSEKLKLDGFAFLEKWAEGILTYIVDLPGGFVCKHKDVVNYSRKSDWWPSERHKFALLMCFGGMKKQEECPINDHHKIVLSEIQKIAKDGGWYQLTYNPLTFIEADKPYIEKNAVSCYNADAVWREVCGCPVGENEIPAAPIK